MSFHIIYRSTVSTASKLGHRSRFVSQNLQLTEHHPANKYTKTFQRIRSKSHMPSC